MRTVAILTSPNAQEARSHRQPVGRRGHPSLRAHRLAGSLWGCRLISGLSRTGRYLIGSSRRTIPGRGRILISKQETRTPNPRGLWFKVNAMYQIHHRCLTANDSPSASCVSSPTIHRLSIVAFNVLLRHYPVSAASDNKISQKSKPRADRVESK